MANGDTPIQLDPSLGNYPVTGQPTTGQQISLTNFPNLQQYLTGPAQPSSQPSSQITGTSQVPQTAQSTEPKIDVLSQSYTKGRTQRPDYIIMHSTDGGEESAVNTLTQGNVSVHYLTTKDGRVMHFVPEADTAYHAGRDLNGNSGNPYTFGIEQVHVDGKEPWPDAQVQASARTAAGIIQRHPWIPVDHIIGHSDIAPGRKQDPVGYPWQQFYGYVNQYLGQGQQQTSNQAQTPPIQQLTQSPGNPQLIDLSRYLQH